MISSFTMQNKNTSETVRFGQDFDCDYIYESGGLDWGNIPATHNTYNYPSQVGNSISSTKINTRDISITAYSFYVLSESERELYSREEWKEYAYEQIKKRKKTLNELINPMDYVRLTIGQYYIEGKPSATPQYGVTEEENNIYFCKFTIDIYCDNPMFRKISDVVNVVSDNFGAFHFPFELIPQGYIMGTRKSYLMLAVENDGDAEVGGRIIIKAKQSVLNPSIENITNGQSLTIKKQMLAGETIIINTEDGSAKGVTGEYEGETSSYLQYWDFINNDWIKYQTGTTLIVYSTEDSSEDYIEVSVEINPPRFGLEEM